MERKQNYSLCQSAEVKLRIAGWKSAVLHHLTLGRDFSNAGHSSSSAAELKMEVKMREQSEGRVKERHTVSPLILGSQLSPHRWAAKKGLKTEQGRCWAFPFLHCGARGRGAEEDVSGGATGATVKPLKLITCGRCGEVIWPRWCRFPQDGPPRARRVPLK